jgi:hypothetical protein
MLALWRNGFKKELKIGRIIKLSREIEKRRTLSLNINKLRTTTSLQ